MLARPSISSPSRSPHSQPQTRRARARSKAATDQPFGIVAGEKIPYKADRLDLLQGDGQNFARHIQQFEAAIMGEFERIDVAGLPIAAELAHDYLFPA